jgi:mono/diheme cytochrome c family protein
MRESHAQLSNPARSQDGRVSIALIVLITVLLAAALIGAIVWTLNMRNEEPIDRVVGVAPQASPEQVERGAYLARAGNCMGCHTARGGVPYAGGRGIPTPFGTIYASNLTPDIETGIGAWSASEFWRAMHNGRARDGRLLYPAFPYPNFTRISREDSDALHAYLRSLPATPQKNRPHELMFPFDQQAALAVWRALYFRAERAELSEGPPRNESPQQVEARRGAYLVEGLGHCNACHASRNALGATSSTLDLAGGLIPVQNWYAPSLTSPLEAGVADWDLQHIVDLLQSGVSTRGAVMGPMSEVVGGSTQYLNAADLTAMAAHLKALPQSASKNDDHIKSGAASANSTTSAGAKLYDQHCVQCHGEQGEGTPGIYPALSGSRAVTMQTSANLVHIVLEGGFPPATQRNPRPFGMPPFATLLSDDDVAALLTHIRSSWGNTAARVEPLEVRRFRTAR